jgi:Tfp pilus assembly protein PilV
LAHETHTEQTAGAANAAGRERGFTIIETCIALLVMMVAALSIASLFTYAIQYNTGANDRALAQAVAQRQMEFLRKTPFDQIASSTTTVTSAGRNFTVVTTACNDGTAACGGSAAMMRITVQVTPQGGGPSWSRSSVTLIALRGVLYFGPYYQ